MSVAEATVALAQSSPAASSETEGRGSGLWIIAAKLVSQVAQLLIFVLAANALTPAEFGHFAIGSAIAILFLILAEAGWAEYIMKVGDGAQPLSEVTSAATLSGVGFTLLAFLGILAVWLGGGSRELIDLLALFTVWILPAALTTVYDGHFVFRRRFRLQAQLRIAGEIVGLLVAAAGLSLGWGVLALVSARAATLVSYLLFCTAITHLPLSFRIRFPHAAEMLQFSGHILQGRFITFLRSYAATLSIGFFLGAAEAGLFRAAERIVAAFAELLGEPMRLLGWGAFRRAETDVELHGATLELRLSDAGAAFIPLVLAISVPVYLGIPLVSETFVAAILGETWKPAALIVSILAIKQFLLAPAFVSEPLLSIAGNIRRMPPVSLFNAAMALVAVVLTAPFGYVAVAVGQVGAAAIALMTTVLLHQKYGHQCWIRIIRRCWRIAIAVLVALAAVWLAGTGLHEFSANPVVILTGQAFVGVLVYGLALRLLDPAVLHDIWRLAR